MKFKIVHRVLCQLEFQSEVAKEFRVSAPMVSRLVTAARKNKHFFDELWQQKEDREAQRGAIRTYIAAKDERNEFIDSTDYLVRGLQEDLGMAVKPKMVQEVLSKDLLMSFRKVKQGSIHANSEHNLILRQQAALVLIGTMKNKKIILNIDETWLGMTDFRRMKWQTKNSTTSVRTL